MFVRTVQLSFASAARSTVPAAAGLRAGQGFGGNQQGNQGGRAFTG